MSNLEKLLAEVRELDEKATKGPWSTVWNNGPGRWKYRLYDTDAGEIYSPQDNCEASDAELKANDAFISRARTLLPKLAEIVEVLSNACAYRAVHPQSNTEEGKCRDALRSAEEIASK